MLSWVGYSITYKINAHPRPAACGSWFLTSRGYSSHPSTRSESLSHQLPRQATGTARSWQPTTGTGERVCAEELHQRTCGSVPPHQGPVLRPPDSTRAGWGNLGVGRSSPTGEQPGRSEWSKMSSKRGTRCVRTTSLACFFHPVQED